MAKGKGLATQVGRAIKAVRTEKGLTQEQLAELLGLQREAVSRMERGGVLPPLDRLAEVADTLGVTLGRLLGDSSLSTIEQAGEIARLLSSLGPEDRVWVLHIVEELVEKLKATKRR